jgi:hypothetical protein
MFFAYFKLVLKYRTGLFWVNKFFCKIQKSLSKYPRRNQNFEKHFLRKILDNSKYEDKGHFKKIGLDGGKGQKRPRPHSI